MTKGRVALPFRFGATDDEQPVPPLRFAPVPRQAGTGGMTLHFLVRELVPQHLFGDWISVPK
jgi:hypothetical protein